MIVAKIYPEPAKRGRGNKSVLAKEFNSGHLSQARLVLKVLPLRLAAYLGMIPRWLRRRC